MLSNDEQAAADAHAERVGTCLSLLNQHANRYFKVMHFSLSEARGAIELHANISSTVRDPKEYVASQADALGAIARHCEGSQLVESGDHYTLHVPSMDALQAAAETINAALKTNPSARMTLSSGSQINR